MSAEIRKNKLGDALSVPLAMWSWPSFDLGLRAAKLQTFLSDWVVLWLSPA